MGFKSSISNFTLLVLLILCLITGQCHSRVFRLEDYGAVNGGKVDSSQALLKAWHDACKWKGRSKLAIYSGTYLVNSVSLSGPCNGPIEFQNSGILKAPLGLQGNTWIEFRYIHGLTLSGGGTFDGQGRPKQGSPDLPTLVRFSFVTNSKAQNVKLINSRSTHLNLFGCNNTTLNQITISSPADSPNTDGIKIGHSNGIKIYDSSIASGDDCVAILTGSKNISVNRVNCGPGHGISIGSLGWSPNEQVEQIFVQNCNLYGTTNGLRIKTKATNMPGMVSNVRYENIFMKYVDNPIIIDQNYCPPKTCAKGNSRVEIRDVKFRNIHGTSKTNVAVNIKCSGSNPCGEIELRDINIKGSGFPTISTCSYASGKAYGMQVPKPCIS
ncbi:polygalacturonase-like [Spinacia oleracea]|uniref:Polygalacturonase-like n=1 Tax=Spinacia oleracea TaxID=3562 RepID=A0ABM3QI15_SPIOL|nr:polygalacturonase-like [Spinacia oleracea]